MNLLCLSFTVAFLLVSCFHNRRGVFMHFTYVYTDTVLISYTSGSNKETLHREALVDLTLLQRGMWRSEWSLTFTPGIIAAYAGEVLGDGKEENTFCHTLIHNLHLYQSLSHSCHLPFCLCPFLPPSLWVYYSVS